MVAVELVIKVLAGIIVGFILYKLRILNDGTNASLSRLLAEIVSPFLIFANIVSISGTGVTDKADVIRVLISGVVIYAVLVPLAYFLTKLLRIEKASEGVFQCLIIFGNVGFIGLPIAESLYGAVGVFYMAILNIHFGLLCFSYGLWLITRDVETEFRFAPKRIINPLIISCVAGLILFFLDIRLPELVVSPISFIGNMTAPLSMILLGSSIASHDLKKIFRQWKLYVLSAIRMVLFPLITYFVAKAVFGPGVLTSILTFYVGAPSAVIISMFTMAYGGDEETATSGVAMMNIFCIITIPATYLLTVYF